MGRFLAILLCCMSISVVQAERLLKQATLVIQAPRISFVGNARYHSVAVRNISEVTAEFDVSLQSLESDPARPSIIGMIRLTKSFISLAPDAEAIIGLVYEPPDDLLDGEYAGSLIIKGEPQPEALKHGGAKSNEELAVMIKKQLYSVPVIIRKGVLSAGVKLEDQGIVSSSEGAWLNLSLTRSGNRSVFGDIKVSAQAAPYLREEVLLLKKSISVELTEQVTDISLKVPDSLDLYNYAELKVAFKERRRHGGRQKALLVIPLHE